MSTPRFPRCLRPFAIQRPDDKVLPQNLTRMFRDKHWALSSSTAVHLCLTVDDDKAQDYWTRHRMYRMN